MSGPYVPYRVLPWPRERASRTSGAVDRRVGLRRRRRHPGRPEGLRALRRARHDRDRGADGPEHRGGDRASTRCPATFIVEQVRAVAEDIGVDAVKIGMLGTAETVRAVREALELLEPGTPIVLDPVMVAESGAVLLDEPARAAIVGELLPRVTVITPNVPEARVLGRERRRRRRRRGRSPAACTRSGRPTWSSPAATATRRPTCSSTARRSSGSPASATPTAPPTARAARTRRRSPPTWRWATTPLEAARAARRIAGEAVRDGSAGSAPAPGPVDVFALTDGRRHEPPGGHRPSGIIGRR